MKIMARVVCDSTSNTHHSAAEYGIGEAVLPRVFFCEVCHAMTKCCKCCYCSTRPVGRRLMVDVCVMTSSEHCSMKLSTQLRSKRDFRACVFKKNEVENGVNWELTC